MASASTNLTAPGVANCPASGGAPVFHLGYRRWLDGLRGVAILLVLAMHLRLLPGGSLGVDIFFVLSGFLITSLLVEEWQLQGSISLKQFYLRRILRLVPAFAVLLLIFAGHTLLFRPSEEWNARWQELAAAGLYAANWISLHGTTMTLLGHTWSLSLEEQFYLLWPLLLLVFLRKLPRRHIVLLLVAGIVASAGLRMVLHHQHRFFGGDRIELTRLYAGLDTRADALLCGCLAALLVAWRMVPNSPRFVRGLTLGAVAGVGAIAFVLLRRDLLSSQCYDGLFTVVAVSVAVVILRLLAAPAGIAGKILETSPLVFVGRISYGLYLFHVLVLECFGPPTLGFDAPVRTVLAGALSIAAAVASFYLVERPFLRLKDRLHAAGKSDISSDSARPSRMAA